MRNLTKTIAAVSLLAPASAYPLGIGDIKLHSALNQKLDAEIALILSDDENISDIKVKLAPPEKFQEAGVPWSYFLSKIQFDSVTKSDGTTVVRLSSKVALREPFLDFLLEVEWAKGNLYREFTVLIDPPTAYTKPVIPVVEKAEQTNQLKPENMAVIKPTAGNVADFDQYGPTNSRDSLWKIAKKTNTYNDVSLEQMMIAIYKANPDAFYKDNVNALLANKTLQIPDKEVILQLSQKKAFAEFKRQDNVWRGRVLAKSTVKQLDTNNTAIQTQLELEAPVEAEITDKVVVGNTGVDASLNDNVESKASSLALDSSAENGGVQSRLDKLEQQLVMMQKMLALKDEQIAALQNRGKLAANSNVSHVEEQKPTEIKQLIKPEQDTTIAKSDTTIKPEVTKKINEVPKPSPKPIVTPAVQTKPEATDSFTTIIGGIGAAVLLLVGVLWWRKRKAEEDSDSESMFATASEISLPDSAEEELSIPAMEDATSYDVGTVGESSFLSEFTPSDFDSFDTEQNEVDPISEADVYLAYGRYQQAEDLMRQAIIEQPDRDECKLKLLEIFYANENKSAFEEYATELISSGKNNDQEFWPKVAEMGSELAPESSLFISEEGEQVNAEIEESTKDNLESTTVNDSSEKIDSIESNSDEVNFDLSVFDQESTDSGVGNEDKNDENSLDFDLSVFDIDEKETAIASNDESSDGESDNLETVDFDLNADSLTGSTLDAEVQDELLNEDEESNETASTNLDLNEEAEVDSAELDPTKDNISEIDLSSSVDSEENEDLENFEFSLDDPIADAEIASETVETIKSELPKETEIFDEFDFDSDAPAVDSVDETDIGVSDLTDMDELETKIDLAKAYIDMGDVDAAKGIAEEVKEKGNSDQKEAAQEIIDQLKES